MEIIFVLLPISLVLALIALCFYVWGVKSGQFDDLETPAFRILEKEEQIIPEPKSDSQQPVND